jgi:hypothetical protein
MAELPDDFARLRANGAEPDIGPDLANLAERMRATVTPVVGYLELISQDASGVAPERYLDWISTIERRLDAMRETSDQISRICAVLRDSIKDPQASTPRAPEARGD